MGFRFRKSKQILPGVRLNVGKKGVGLSFGVKGLRHSINTSGRRTTTVGIPGTGISYSKSSTKKKNKAIKAAQKSSRNTYANNTQVRTSSPPQPKQKMKPLTKAIIFWAIGFFFIPTIPDFIKSGDAGPAGLAIVLAVGFALIGFYFFRKRKQQDPQQPIHGEPAELHSTQIEATEPVQTEGGELTSAVLNYENELLSKLAETEAANDIMDVHYAYNNLIEFYYKYRESSPEYYDKAIFYSQKDVDLFPTLKPLFMADLQMVPRLPAFQRLAMLYDQRGDYEKAIEICGLGIKYDLADGTQGGFRARRERIERKLIEAQNT